MSTTKAASEGSWEFALIFGVREGIDGVVVVVGRCIWFVLPEDTFGGANEGRSVGVGWWWWGGLSMARSCGRVSA